MALSLKPKVAARIEDQQPSFIREDHPDFIAFLKSYYEFMEQEIGPLAFIRNVSENIDVDKTTEIFLEKIKKNVFPLETKNIEPFISDPELIKNLREFYLMKGSEESYNWILQKFFANSAELYYGKDLVLRSSDNKYINPAEIVVTAQGITLEELVNYSESLIVQNITKASAVIENTYLYEPSNIRNNITGNVTVGSNIITNISDITLVKIGDIIGYDEIATNPAHEHYHLGTSLLFPELTTIVSIDVNTSTATTSAAALYTGTTQTIGLKDPYYKVVLDKNTINNQFSTQYPCQIKNRITDEVIKEVYLTDTIIDVEIVNSGSLYQTHQKVRSLGGTGTNLILEVNNVLPGKINSAYVIDGGSGYAVGDEFDAVPIDGKGKDGKIKVVAIDGTGAELVPILETVNITIPTPAPHGYALGDIITLGIKDRLGANPEYIVSGIAGGTPLDKFWLINTIAPGRNYSTATKVSIFDGGTLVQNVAYSLNGNGGIVVEQITPNTTWTAPIIYVGGSGAHGTVTIASNQITGYTVTAGGINYTDNSRIEYYADAAFTIPITGTLPEFKLTLSNTSITGITGNGGYFDISNGIYYYKVLEKTGQNAALEMVNYTYLTAVTPVYSGEFDSNIQLDNITLSTDGSGYLWKAAVEYDLAFVEIKKTGKNYTNPTAILSGGNATPPSLVLTTAENDEIYKIHVVRGGNNYSDATVIINGNGTGAAATAVISAGKIVSITVTNPGSGYTYAEAYIESLTGDRALLNVQLIEKGGIKSVNIV